jgi:hypothetical integral membrane protein (TIGR02206 family)
MNLNLNEFTLFGQLHLLVFLSLFIGTILVFLFRSNPLLRYFLAAVLIAQLVAFNGYHILRGDYDIYRYLPLHLCTVSAILCPIALLTKNTILNNLVLFWGLIPAFLAIALPDMGKNEGVLTFRFWEFFVSHVFIVLTAIYISFHTDSKFKIKNFDTWKMIIIAYFTLVLYAIGIVMPINYVLGNGANYLYLVNKASNGMGFLPNAPLYVPALFALSFVVFVLEAIIYMILNHFKKIKPSVLH